MSAKSIISASRLCLVPARQTAVVRGSQARFGTSSVNGVNYSQVPKPLQSKMKHFQLPNGLPIHVRGGPVDKILYGLTATVCGLGLFECFRVFYVLSFPKRN